MVKKFVLIYFKTVKEKLNSRLKLSHLAAKPNESNQLTRHNKENHSFKTNLVNSLGAGYVSHLRVSFVCKNCDCLTVGSGTRFVHDKFTINVVLNRLCLVA